MGLYRKITASSGLISLGNTGARVSDPRITYAKILAALIEFRKHNNLWEISDQIEFGRLLNEFEIFYIKSDNIISSDKDVRLKTGFISHLGFTTENRLITDAGKELLYNSTSSATNDFEISEESYTYLKQLLKYQQIGFDILPLFSLIYSCLEFDNELPIDFVTYIWPDTKTKEELIDNIAEYKKHSDYKKAVYQAVAKSANTTLAQNNISLFFDFHDITDTEELKILFYAILPHGKGNKFKDKTIALFHDLYSYWTEKNNWSNTQKKQFISSKLKLRHKDISSKKPKDYQEILFGTTSLNNSSNWEKIISFFENTDLISSPNEAKLILNFHILYMYIKKLSVCEEYQDLNIRHLKLADIFIFENEIVKLDIIFLYLFKSAKEHLLNTKSLPQNEYRKNLETSHKDIGEIYDFFKVDLAELTLQIAIDFPEIKQTGLKNFALKKREERLQRLINYVFTRENIIKIFENIFPRNDKKVRELIKTMYQDYEATIPALFEYLLGISFYWLSQKQVQLSDILNANLDANLLPKTHASGGQADMILHLKLKDYLIEATLSEKDNQRQMESEPIPRHLAKHILESNPDSLTLFIAGKLDPNNLVILRNYKFSTWYNPNGQNVDSMDILPLTITNMIYLLKQDMKFEILTNKMNTLLNSETRDGFRWYTDEINPTFSWK